MFHVCFSRCSADLQQTFGHSVPWCLGWLVYVVFTERRIWANSWGKWNFSSLSLHRLTLKVRFRFFYRMPNKSWPITYSMLLNNFEDFLEYNRLSILAKKIYKVHNIYPFFCTTFTFFLIFTLKIILLYVTLQTLSLFSCLSLLTNNWRKKISSC